MPALTTPGRICRQWTMAAMPEKAFAAMAGAVTTTYAVCMVDLYLPPLWSVTKF
jgi:hypothetical protein